MMSVLEAKSFEVAAAGPTDARAVDGRGRELGVFAEVLRRTTEGRGGDFLLGLLGDGDRATRVRRLVPES